MRSQVIKYSTRCKSDIDGSGRPFVSNRSHAIGWDGMLSNVIERRVGWQCTQTNAMHGMGHIVAHCRPFLSYSMPFELYFQLLEVFYAYFYCHLFSSFDCRLSHISYNLLNWDLFVEFIS